MATDQSERTTNDQTGINYTAANCDDLKANFASNLEIRAQDVITLLNYYDDFRTHTHALTDYTRVDGFFGNLDGDQTLSEADVTGNALGMSTTPADPVSGTTEITQTYHEALRTAFNSLRTHYHSWDDKTAP